LEQKLPLSIVLPCYNEEKRLEPTLSQALDYMKRSIQSTFEVVFVNDGSTDGTQEILESARRKFPSLIIDIVCYTPNRGKGYAVRTGVLRARGDKILMMDADFSIELSEMFKFTEKLDEADIVIGTKKHLLTQTVRHQSFLRRFLGKGFTLLADLLLGLRFTDITCGLKGYRGSVGKDLFRRQRITRWSYDSETLFLAKKLNYSVIEIPVRWHHEERSKVSPYLDTVRSLKELMSVLFFYYTGKYRI
jgi:dolichyl-phosphate beta-glucosyltransferase